MIFKKLEEICLKLESYFESEKYAIAKIFR